jgi:hypothetical protein
MHSAWHMAGFSVNGCCEGSRARAAVILFCFLINTFIKPFLDYKSRAHCKLKEKI